MIHYLVNMALAFLMSNNDGAEHTL